jgi:hypothetical protein
VQLFAILKSSFQLAQLKTRTRIASSLLLAEFPAASAHVIFCVLKLGAQVL